MVKFFCHSYRVKFLWLSFREILLDPWLAIHQISSFTGVHGRGHDREKLSICESVQPGDVVAVLTNGDFGGLRRRIHAGCASPTSSV
jgi:hypothetical protein